MSAIGTKRTSPSALHMSAFGGKADMASVAQNVRSHQRVLRMLRSEFSAEIVARPSGWLTSTFRMAICPKRRKSDR
jgi:hypothetical protein